MFSDLLPKNLDFGAATQALREVIAAPMANLTLALLLLAVVGLFLLVVVIAILFFLVGGEEEHDEDGLEGTPEGASAEEPQQQSAEQVPAGEGEPDVKPEATWLRKAALILGALLVPLLIVASLITAYVVTGTDQYCMTCHSPAEDAAAASVPGTPVTPELHAKIGCIECHEVELPGGAVQNSIERVRHLAVWVTGTRSTTGGAAHLDRCQSCHDSIKSTTVNAERGLKVSHVEPLEAGMTCSECHPNAGHNPLAEGPGMSACLRCHDGKRLSGGCETCHFKDPAVAAIDKRTFAASELVADPTCGGCHNQKKCDACHGLRMPHTQAFIGGEHARQAAFGKKVVCMRCHLVWDCAQCHQVPPNGGLYWGHGGGIAPSPWIQEHKVLPPGVRTAGCGCHGRSPYAKRGDYCAACH